MKKAHSISEAKIIELYPDDWNHSPEEWKSKGIVFEENKNAGTKLCKLLNLRANCKTEKI